MQPEATSADQIQINLRIKEQPSARPDTQHSSSAQAGKPNPLDGARPTTADQIPTPPDAPTDHTLDNMVTMSDQTPVSLLGALATGANELEPVGFFPWPFASRDVEYVFQAQFVTSSAGSDR